MAKGNEGKGGMIAIVVAGVVALAGVVVAVLFATGVLGGPNMVGTYVLTGLKQGDEDLSSLLSLLNAGGGESTLEMRKDGTCTMKTTGTEVSEEEEVDFVEDSDEEIDSSEDGSVEDDDVESDGVEGDGEDVLSVDDEEEVTTGESVTECTYDVKQKTLTVAGEAVAYTFEKDTISFESEGLTMIYTRKSDK